MALTHDTELTRRIIGLAMRVHARIGPGLLESTYELCLCHELARDGLSYARQVEMPLECDGMHLTLADRIDIVVQDQVLLEIKSVERILPVHEAQLLTYLRFSPCAVGLLLNFNWASLTEGTRRQVR